MRFIKGFLCVCAAALALSICGCKKDSKSTSSGSDDSKDAKSDESESFKSTAFTGKFSPKVSEDAVIALGLNLDIQKLSKIGNIFLDQAIDKVEGPDKKMFAEVKEAYTKFISDPFKEAPADLKEFAFEVGLRNTKIGWAVASIGDINFRNGFPLPEPLPEITVAIATDINVEKIVACFNQKIAELPNGKFKIVEGNIAGEKAWMVFPKRPIDNTRFREMNLEPCFTSLDGQLVLLGSNMSALKKCISLYREGKGEGRLLRDFKPADGDLIRLVIKDLDAILRDVPSNALRKIIPPVPNDKELVLRETSFALTSQSDSQVALSLRLQTASQKDANDLRKSFQERVDMADNPDFGLPKDMVELIKRIKITSTGPICEYEIDDLLPIAAGVVVPNFLKYRRASQQATCESNMKWLQGAAEQCLMSGKPITDANLFGPNGYIPRKPTCPCGGEYIIKASSDGEYSISCPNAKADPRFPHVLPGYEEGKNSSYQGEAKVGDKSKEKEGDNKYKEVEAKDKK